MRQLTCRLTSLFGLLLLSTPLQLAAESGYGLIVSPEKCFVLEDSTECEVSVKLEWRAEFKSDYCLYLSGNPSPLNCWTKANQGIFEYLLTSDVDTQFEITSTRKDLPSYQAQVKIFKQIKQLKKRRRNPWSFY